jgi:nitroreductase/FMN reductase [NAD(P)H]
MATDISNALAARFADAPEGLDSNFVLDDSPAWQTIAQRASCRRFSTRPVDDALVQHVCALALCAPSKSDLQQRDIVIVDDPDLRARIVERVPGGRWVADAGALLVFCGNNRRHRQLMAWREMPFTNDHLDAFFNAAVDAGIALATALTAAEAVGLGGCPISVIRDHAQWVSEQLDLPDHVFPVAGLALGWPDAPGESSKRLPLAATVHRNRFDDANVQSLIGGYDRWRAAHQPYAAQREPERFGESASYGWSEDKARQYADPQREAFGQYIRQRGFSLD